MPPVQLPDSYYVHICMSLEFVEIIHRIYQHYRPCYAETTKISSGRVVSLLQLAFEKCVCVQVRRLYVYTGYPLPDFLGIGYPGYCNENHHEF